MREDMRGLLLLLLPMSLSIGCLPNPQSEWTSSEGGSQRSTLDDPTIAAQSTVPSIDLGFVVDPAWSGHPHHDEHRGRASRESRPHIGGGGGGSGRSHSGRR